MLDLDKLAEEKEKATIDKADLFDFYHKNWNSLVAEIRRLRSIDNSDPRQYADCWEDKKELLDDMIESGGRN